VRFIVYIKNSISVTMFELKILLKYKCLINLVTSDNKRDIDGSLILYHSAIATHLKLPKFALHSLGKNNTNHQKHTHIKKS